MGRWARYLKMNLIQTNTQNSNMPFTPYKPPEATTSTSERLKSGFKPYIPPQKVEAPSPAATPSPAPAQRKGGGVFSFLSSASKAIGEIALQPARFIERTGRAVGDYAAKHVSLPFEEQIAKGIGLTKENVTSFEESSKEGLQEQVGGSEYATPAYESGKEALGGAIQAAANLSTPFVGGIGGLAAQGAALAGGKALEEDKSLGEAGVDALIGGASSAIIGKGSQLAGKVIGSGARALKQEAFSALRPVAKKLAPYFTGINKAEFNTAFTKHPELTKETLDILQQATDPTEAEGILRSRLLSKARSIAETAKEVEEKAFDDAITAVKNEFPDATGDVHRVVRDFNAKLPKFGRPVSASEKIAMDSVKEVMTEPREYTIDGMRTLLQDLYALASRTEQGTPARKAAMSAWADVRNELSKATKGKIDPAMKAYTSFKDDMLEVSPVWSESVTEDSSRNFVKNLSGTERTAALEALQRLGKRAKTDMTPDLLVNRIAKKLAVDQKITGSRLGEILGAGALFTAGGAIGEAIGGEKGKSVAQTGAALLGAKALAPSVLSKIILSYLDKTAVPITGSFRKALSKALQNPLTLQAIMRAVQGGPDETK